MDKSPLDNMNLNSGKLFDRNGYFHWKYNLPVYIPDLTRTKIIQITKVPNYIIINSGVYARYQKLLWKRKFPILIKNIIIGWFLILCPTFAQWVLICFFPGLPEPIWFLTGTFTGIWGLFIYLDTADRFPRVMRDIHLNRKCYLGYNIKYL